MACSMSLYKSAISYVAGNSKYLSLYWNRSIEHSFSKQRLEQNVIILRSYNTRVRFVTWDDKHAFRGEARNTARLSPLKRNKFVSFV